MNFWFYEKKNVSNWTSERGKQIEEPWVTEKNSYFKHHVNSKETKLTSFFHFTFFLQNQCKHTAKNFYNYTNLFPLKIISVNSWLLVSSKIYLNFFLILFMRLITHLYIIYNCVNIWQKTSKYNNEFFVRFLYRLIVRIIK